MPLFEGLYPIPGHRCHYSGLIELDEVVFHVVICDGHHVKPEP